MSKSREQRIDDALSQLVDRTLPIVEDEDENAADARYYQALERAREAVERGGEVAVVRDVGHVVEVIKARLRREHDSPDRSVYFGNLCERLLAQPVLSQKWAILHLLSQLAPSATTSSNSSPGRPTPPAHSSRNGQVGTAQQQQDRRESVVMDEAFSRNGLHNLPSPREQRERPEQQEQKQMRSSYVPRHRIEAVTSVERDASNGSHAQGLSKTRLRLDPSESTLLRDLPFTLQGVSSTTLTFSSASSLMIPNTLPAPIVSLLHALAEPSLLYKSICQFLESSDGGLVGQSLRSAIGIETRSYLGLVATLESQIRRALAGLEDNSSQRSLGQASVTLKRCVIWTREATMGLRLMSVIVEQSRNRKGGQLISLIHSYSTSHGDPFVGAFAERLLLHVTRPFYDMLRSWIYDGELSDPFQEFFVSEKPADGEDGNAKGGATSVWEDKYILDEQIIPSIVTAEFAKKVFLIGKSLNFIRYGCGDPRWVEIYSKQASRELRYGDTATLETSIDEAYKTTMAQAIHLMTDKFKLVEHLTGLKKYLLLGQGDFVALLMESLAPNLDRPANSQYRHTLTAQLELAIRNSNAQYDPPDVLRRLDARMLELSYGEVGWDVFTLEYKVDAPVDVIVNAWSSKQYLKVFNFLWRVKRVEYALGSTWRRCMTGARGVLSSIADKLGKDWKTARCVMAEMIHFVGQLQYYILFEVIEASWDQLQTDMSKPDCTLDDLIQAHSKYLKAITRKGLLASSSLDFSTQLHELLKLMLAFKDAVDGLYSFSVAEFTRRQEKATRIDTRTAQGQWGTTEHDDEDTSRKATRNKSMPRSRDADSPLPPPLLAIGAAASGSNTSEASVLLALRQRLRELGSEFQARITGLLGDLAYQPDMDLRFLGVVMNFNESYKIVRRSRRRPATSIAPTTAATANAPATSSGPAGVATEDNARTKDASKGKEQHQHPAEKGENGLKSGKPQKASRSGSIDASLGTSSAVRSIADGRKREVRRHVNATGNGNGNGSLRR